MVECISARDAWTRLASDPRAILIDVRTEGEWQAVGLPDLSTLGRVVMALSWDPYDAQGFADRLRAEVPQRDIPLLFLCRSGMRSQQTAELAAHLGYTQSANIVEGYEGPPDSSGRRGRVCGWQFEALPCTTPAERAGAQPGEK
ncbi:rhodanese-like domain-containing protein [Swaminathania salitolerans]|uniref:Rhodanese domain-containing protein n=1 Tax=Swaminathania salitolerans TaxID=182838 RepID=A0A511BQI1_9PROT|nr:rhodanese-like domain-containing protein [Swaminathania salitolerans]GBQ11692.1 sulfide dehydrogenase [Swaminathania salitolerans LMG 21291]GEL02590.1 hypothetical protein SSA02_17530 [Swaminathania salitolerans]